MIIVTVTYPPYNGRPERSKDFTFEELPSARVGRYLSEKKDEGRVTRIVVSNRGKVIFDSDRDEDWF